MPLRRRLSLILLPLAAAATLRAGAAQAGVDLLATGCQCEAKRRMTPVRLDSERCGEEPIVTFVRERRQAARLLFTSDAAKAEGRSKVSAPGKPAVSYSIGESLTADVAYKHAFVFGASPSLAVREHQFTSFSTDRERDIVQFRMSWQLPWNSVDLGYRFESTRADGNGAASGQSIPEGWLPGSAGTLHGLTLGVTKKWGGAP